MSQYLVLIYGDEKANEAGGQGLWDDTMKGHMAFGENRAASLAGGNALQGTHTATSVRPEGNGFTVTDGPFVETKEALGGYYLIEAADLDEAITVAKDIPMPFGGVEVRPIQTFE
ncbi:MAG: YCII-related protein [Frankiales bacterium]|nr:YCII-related protein [Frankiales bacterium]